MDIMVKGYLDRAENELVLANANFSLSTNDEIKVKLGISPNKTFFNNVISESYYAIFYSAKAFLLSLGIKTKTPKEHKKTYEEFKKIIESKNLDKQLAEIYEEESSKAETLLKIFFDEKRNRGRFTYNINANANKPFAETSIKNARFFTSAIKYLIENKQKQNKD
ncbi:HEPN domain-containing protein [Candidatus Pacearchaeota archaeon]|nr:HEPN domain-containing protein [Candidatus Pacearchaeota archaeon]